VFGKKQFWPNLKYCSSTFLEGIEENHEIIIIISIAGVPIFEIPAQWQVDKWGPVPKFFNYWGINIGASAQGNWSEGLKVCSGRWIGTSENTSGCSGGQTLTGVPILRQGTSLFKSTNKRTNTRRKAKTMKTQMRVGRPYNVHYTGTGN
jgi:hypothetical protein